MSDVASCEDCEQPYCPTCYEPCVHRQLCPECDKARGCWECRDDAAGERDLSWLREA